MKNIAVFILLALSFVSITSCQKEIDADLLTNTPVVNTDSTDFKVRTYTESDSSALFGFFSQTFTLTYDAEGRLLTLVDANDSSTRITYTYPSAGSYTVNAIQDTSYVNEIAFLNNTPLVDSTSQYNDMGDTTLEKYLYDGSGRLIQFKDYNYTTSGGSQVTNISDNIYDADGNIIQESQSIGIITTYEYSTELNTLDRGFVYEPKNKRLVSKTTIDDAGTITTINHTYTFDSLHRITSEKQEYSNGEIVIDSYTY